MATKTKDKIKTYKSKYKLSGYYEKWFDDEQFMFVVLHTR